MDNFAFFPHLEEWFRYSVDVCQRSVLFFDTLRQRGDNYWRHVADGQPPVLIFDYEMILDGRTLETPVNYALILITPPDNFSPTDPDKRPFVIIDPRAGHGPGISGFKIDSEIGIVLRQAHPCYAIIFFTTPEPNQTIDTVWRAEKQFLHAVNQRHSHQPEKPMVIGNCQGGWALAMLAATIPDHIGPIMLVGSPLSYWAGIVGKYPMRYTGGLSGGTWTASWLSDIGNGQFDGAHLANSFEWLNPGYHFWYKPYQLYAKIDTETERFLAFERWWGGHYLLNKAEMEWITQNLFIGNSLSQGHVHLEGEKNPVDLRHIRSPIIILASWADTITPPQQALAWITDLYDSVEAIQENKQTIVYCLTQDVGHLGAFVSSKIAQNEHTQILRAVDVIESLPPGLYEAILSTETSSSREMLGIRFEARDIEAIQALDDGREDEEAFQRVREISKFNQQLYDSIFSPWVRAFSTPLSAYLGREGHSARLQRKMLSSLNPWMSTLPYWANLIKQQRQPVSEKNLFWNWQTSMTKMIKQTFDTWLIIRDTLAEMTFKAVYESPTNSAFQGIKCLREHGVCRQEGGWERSEMIHLKRQELSACYTQGDIVEGFLRLLLYISMGRGSSIDTRPFNAIRSLIEQSGLSENLPLSTFKAMVRRQTWLLRNDEARALTTLSSLLPEPQQRQMALELAILLLERAGNISSGKKERLYRAADSMKVDSPLLNGKTAKRLSH